MIHKNYVIFQKFSKFFKNIRNKIEKKKRKKLKKNEKNFMTCCTFSNSELNSELENVDMTPYMHVFKKFIFTSEHFSNRIRGTHLADLTQ